MYALLHVMYMRELLLTGLLTYVWSDAEERPPNNHYMRLDHPSSSIQCRLLSLLVYLSPVDQPQDTKRISSIRSSMKRNV